MIEPEPILPNDQAFLDATNTEDPNFIAWLKPLAGQLPIDWFVAEHEVREAVVRYAQSKLKIKFRNRVSPAHDYIKQNHKWEDTANDEPARFKLVAEAMVRYGGKKKVIATALGIRWPEFQLWLEGAQARRFILDGRPDRGQRAAYLFGAKLVRKPDQIKQSHDYYQSMSERHQQWAEEASKHSSAYAYAKASGISQPTALRRFRALNIPTNRYFLDARINRVAHIKQIMQQHPMPVWHDCKTAWWANEVMKIERPAPHQRVALTRDLRECGLVPYRVRGRTEIRWVLPQYLTQEQAERIVGSVT